MADELVQNGPREVRAGAGASIHTILRAALGVLFVHTGRRWSFHLYTRTGRHWRVLSDVHTGSSASTDRTDVITPSPLALPADNQADHRLSSSPEMVHAATASTFCPAVISPLLACGASVVS